MGWQLFLPLGPLNLIDESMYPVDEKQVGATAPVRHNWNKLTFYTGAAMSLATLCYGAAAGALTLRMTPTAWLFACIISVTTTVGAFSLLQLGVKLAGPSNAAIASATEPLVGVVLSAAILGEAVTQRKAAGVALIVASIVFVALAGAAPRTERKENGLQRH